MCFSSVAWFCCLTEKNKFKLTRVVSQASKIIGMFVQHLEDIVQSVFVFRLDIVMKDESHPFYDEVTVKQIR